MKLALVRGAGDVATGVALRLRREGYAVVCTELPRPTCLRRAVSFAEAVYEGTWQVEGVEAHLARGPEEALRLAERGKVPVLAPEGDALAQLRPRVLVDARMAKRNLGTRIEEAPVVIGLGPGFVAGVDCHAAVETLDGPDLGRVYLSGSPIPPTHEPCGIGGLSQGRVVRAPAPASSMASDASESLWKWDSSSPAVAGSRSLPHVPGWCGGSCGPGSRPARG